GGGQPARAREEGAVRGGAAGRRGDSERERAVERRRVGGGEVLRHYDPGAAQRRAAAAGEGGDDLPRHARQVLGARLHVLVVEGAVVGGDCLGGVVPRPRRVLSFLEDRAAGGTEQRLVGGAEQGRVAERRRVVAG